MCSYYTDKHLKQVLCGAKLVSQSPTDVCVKCFDEAAQDYNTRWLTWLECAQPDSHKDEEGMPLIVGDDHEVVEVIELPRSLERCHPSELSLCKKLRQRGGCPDEKNCKSAHSIEELEYWKWSLIHKLLEKVHTILQLRLCMYHNVSTYTLCRDGADTRITQYICYKPFYVAGYTPGSLF